MASQSRVRFSGEEPQIGQIGQHHHDTTSSLRLYFSRDNPDADALFAGKSGAELQEKLDCVADENERLISMNLLSAL